jgi:hypothetical protein
VYECIFAAAIIARDIAITRGMGQVKSRLTEAEAQAALSEEQMQRAEARKDSLTKAHLKEMQDTCELMRAEAQVHGRRW